MDLENPVLPFWTWLGEAGLVWLLVLAGLGVGSLLVAFLVSAVKIGPARAGDRVYKVLTGSIGDLFLISPRRVFALAWLAIQESLRRWVLFALALYAIVLLFASWFLSRPVLNPSQLYVETVLSLSRALVGLSVIFLSAFSLPADIANHTIYTIVTKPVRSTEIILGRVFGFMTIASVMVLVMGLCNYFFVTGMARHSHDVIDLSTQFDSENNEMDHVGATSEDSGHFHRILLDGDLWELLGLKLRDEESGVAIVERVDAGSSAEQSGLRADDRIESEPKLLSLANWKTGLAAARAKFTVVRGAERFPWNVSRVTIGETEPAQGHYHEIDVQVVDGVLSYLAGAPLGQFQARKPIYGTLSFLDRQGRIAEKGVSVGYEWAYRSYIEGGTQAAAIWTLSGLEREDYPNGLPIELSVRVYRTNKGNVAEGIPGQIVLRNPLKRDLETDPWTFRPAEFGRNSHVFGLEGLDPSAPDAAEQARIQLDKFFEDYVHEGNLEVELSCSQRGQYYGMAQPDLYLMPEMGSFEVNFLKAHLLMWAQMALIVVFGVMFSTFLNRAVATMATMFAIVGGAFQSFMRELSEGEVLGGGPFESLKRMLDQGSMVGDLEPTFTNKVLQGLDYASRIPFFVFSRLAPDLPSMGAADYVARGFDIPWNLVFVQAASTLGYALPAIFLACVFLRVREVAK